MIVFTSDKESQYAVKGSMIKALNKLKTADYVFDIDEISRKRLIILIQY